MRKVIFLSLLFLCFVSVSAQNCNGISCIANPNILQEELIICYEDSDTMQYNCSGETCNKVCELTEFTYTTAYHNGSSFIWTVIGGQLTSVSPSGNAITIFWDSTGSGSVSVIEQDTLMCSESSTICIDIIPKPLATILTLANSDTICYGSPIYFQGVDLNNSTIITQIDSCNQYDSTQFAYELQYFWDFGDGSTSVDQNPVHVFDTSGSYSVSLTISNSCQCSDVTTTDIVVVNSSGPSVTTCVGPLCEGDTSEYCTDAILPNWDVIGGILYNTLSSDSCIVVIWDNQNNELDDGAGELLVGDLNSSCGQSQSFYSVPIVPLNPIITGNTIACPGAMESYSFECIPGIDYYWSISGGWGGTILSGNNTSEILVAFDQWIGNTSFQITLYISSTTLACTPAPVTINVDVLPLINIMSSTPVVSDACEDATVNYSDWSGSQYNWTVINGSIISSTPNSQIDVIWDQGPGNGMIIIEPINSGIYCQTSKSYPINIIERPSAAIKILGDSLICPGSTYMYSVEESNATSSSNLSYIWTVTGGIASNNYGETCTIDWGPVGPYSISITNTLMQWLNCTSSVFTKIINTAPVVLPVINGSSIVCTNDRSNFEITNVYPNDAVITWGVVDANLGSVVSGQGSSNVIIEWGNQLGATDITATVEICGTIVSNIFSVTLTGASVSFTIPNNIVCPQSSVTFTASSAIGDFSWNFGDGNTTTLTNISTVSHIYSTSGEHNVILTLIDGNQCTSIATNLIEISGPVGHINPNDGGGVAEYCDGHTISELLSVTTASNANPSSWEWYHNGMLVQSGGSNYAVSLNPPNYLESGSYSVILTDVNGCSNSTDNLNLNIVTCPVNSCTGGSCGTCPNTPIPHTFACNSNIGTWDVNFSSTNGNPAIFAISGVIFASNTTNASYTFTEAGIYTIGCYDLAGYRIGLQEITIPFVVDWKSFPYCDAANNNQITMHFRDTSSYLLGISGISYQWDFGDGNTSALQNPIHTYTVPGIYTVNFTVSYGSLTCNKIQQIEAEFNTSFVYSGPECEKTPTISFLSGFFPPNIQILSWQWDFDDGGTSAREIPDRTYSQSGLYNPSLLATSINGCIASVTIPLVIYSKPTIISLSSVNSFCVNDPQLDLSTVVSYSTSNGETESWSGNGVEYISGIYYFNPLLAGGGTHEVCVTITNINGCTDDQCINIIVICPEKPRIFGESEYCSNSFNNYINLHTNSIYTTYQWHKNGVGIGTSWSSIWDNVGVGVYDYMVEVLDNNGCTVFSEPFTLNMNASPNFVSVSANVNPCPNEEITLSHNGMQSGVDYYWNTLPQQTAPTVTVTAIADYEYTVTAINEFGCESVSYPIIVPSEIPLCGVLSGCLCDDEIMNSAGLINITGLNNSWQYSNYEWLLNGIPFSPSQNVSSLIIDPLDPNYLTICAGVITLAVTDNNGCLSASNPLTIEPNCNSCFTTNPNYNISQTICTGESLVFGSNTYSNPGIYINSFQTSNGCDSNVILNLTVLPLLTSMQNVILCLGDSINIGSNIYYSEGNYRDTLNNSVGCDSVIITQITISEPSVSFTLVSSLLTAQVTGGTVPYYYEFGNQDGILLTSFNNFGSTISFNPIENGMYYFFIIDANNCASDTVFYLVDIFSTLIDEFGVGNLNIFPNPSKDIFSITFTSEDIQDLKVKILNIVGEVIISEDLEQFVGEYTNQVSLKENAKGIYFLKIKTNNGVVNKKLILQ